MTTDQFTSGLRSLLPWVLIAALVWVNFDQTSRHEKTLVSLSTGTLTAIQDAMRQLQAQVEVNGLVVAPFMRGETLNGPQ